MGFHFIQWVIICYTIIIYFDTQISQFSNVRAPSVWPLCLSLCPVIFENLLTFLAQHVPSKSCPFLALTFGSALLPGSF